MKTRIIIIDYILIILSVLLLLGVCIYYFNILMPNGEYGAKDYDPFYEYNSNKGIIIITTLRFIFSVLIFLFGYMWIKNKEISYSTFKTILICVFVLAILEWIELWYGSTFYYGEVRDKQGLGFPILSLLLMLYFFVRVRIPKNVYRIGLILGTIMVYLWLFRSIQDDWKLNNELFLPWTTIQLY
jgi:hypothetical protein